MLTLYTSKKIQCPERSSASPVREAEFWSWPTLCLGALDFLECPQPWLNQVQRGARNCTFVHVFVVNSKYFWFRNHLTCTSSVTNSCNLFDLLTGNICLLCSIFTHCFDIRCCNKVLRSSKDSQSARCILLVVGKLGRLCFGHALHGLLRFLLGFWMSLTSMLCAKARFSRLRWFHFTYHIFRQPTMWKAYLHVWRHILYKHILIYICIYTHTHK